MGHPRVPESEYAGYRVHPYAYSQYIKGAKPVLMDFLEQGEDWGGISTAGMQDGQPQQLNSYDELYRRAAENELKAYYIDDKDLYDKIYAGYFQKPNTSSSGFHSGDDIFMSGKPENAAYTLAHETGHEFFGHAYEGNKTSSVPELTKYQKLDRALLGFLPSFNEYAFRPDYIPMKPEMKRNFNSRASYNKRMRDKKYNPLFADAPFGKFGGKMEETADPTLQERITTSYTEMPDGKFIKTKDVPEPKEREAGRSTKPWYVF